MPRTVAVVSDISDMSTDYLGYVFGAVVAAGGAMGYVKKRSLPSLVAGLAFGGLAAGGAYHVSVCHHRAALHTPLPGICASSHSVPRGRGVSYDGRGYGG